jgi:hypothetical protein
MVASDSEPQGGYVSSAARIVQFAASMSQACPKRGESEQLGG